MRHTAGLLICAVLVGCQAPPPPPAARAPTPGGCAPQPADYPLASLHANEQGTTRIAFSVGADGRALNPVVVQSSGHERLDAAALRRLAACTLRAPADTPPDRRFAVEFVWKISP